MRILFIILVFLTICSQSMSVVYTGTLSYSTPQDIITFIAYLKDSQEILTDNSLGSSYNNGNWQFDDAYFSRTPSIGEVEYIWLYCENTMIFSDYDFFNGKSKSWGITNSIGTMDNRPELEIIVQNPEQVNLKWTKVGKSVEYLVYRKNFDEEWFSLIGTTKTTNYHDKEYDRIKYNCYLVVPIFEGLYGGRSNIVCTDIPLYIKKLNYRVRIATKWGSLKR